MKEKQDEKWIQLIKKKKEEGLLQVIDFYSPLLYTIVKSKLYKYPDSIDEVMNLIFYKIWENIHQFNPEKSSFKNWIAAIATYQSIDELRKILSRNLDLSLEVDLAAPDSNPENLLLQEELFQELLNLLSNLKEEDQKIFLDLFFHGLSYSQVAKKYGLKVSNLYNRVSRSRKLLKSIAKEGSNEE